VERESKQIITREWVENELRFYNTADIKYLTVNLFSLGLVLGLLIYLALLLGWSVTASLWLKIVPTCLLGGVYLIIMGSLLAQLIEHLMERRALKKGNFDVVVRQVQYKTEKLDHRYAARHHHLRLEEYLVFDQFGAIKVDHDEYSRTSAGDEFYMVVYYLPKPKVRLRYSKRSYQYRED
jgi:hypothetical protein